jgi:hypothetical protein
VSLWLRQSESTKKATAWVVLLALTFCTLPIPIARLAAPKGESAVPYPCENCPCGCDGPEKCWTKCCCMTPTQRLEWAKKRGVTPPSYAVLADPSDAKPSCCKSASKRSCCASKVSANQTSEAGRAESPEANCCTKCNEKCSADVRSCCDKEASNCCKSKAVEHKEEPPQKDKPDPKVVLSLFAAQCNGFTFGVSQLPIFVIPKPPIRLVASELIVIRHEIVDDFFESSAREVPTPPPRCA